MKAEPAKVLIVEVDKTWEGIIKRYVEKLGLEADTSASCADAFSKIQANDYTFVTLDLSLHKDRESYEGLELLRLLEESNIAVPIIVISANDISHYIIDACNFENVFHYCDKSQFHTKEKKKEFEAKIAKVLSSLPWYFFKTSHATRKICQNEVILNLLEYSLTGKKRCYILFMDCENFCRYDDEQQANIFNTLINSAKNTDLIKEASKGEGFMPILTGDGMAIIFSSESYALFPLKLAFQIQEKIHNDVLKYAIRFGIHYGDLFLFENPLGLKQLIGSQLNKTARIMDFGRGGHILSSKEYFTQHVLKTSDVEIDAINKKELGMHKHVKGEEFTIYNYYTERYGNKSKKLHYG